MLLYYYPVRCANRHRAQIIISFGWEALIRCMVLCSSLQWGFIICIPVGLNLGSVLLARNGFAAICCHLQLLLFAAICCHLLPLAASCCHLLPFAPICYNLLQFADICCCLLLVATICCHLLPVVASCWHFLLFAAICYHLLLFASI